MTIRNLGPYELDGVIGRGGMGTVYKATDMESGDVVAVKSLAPTYSLDEHFRARFESEIKALMQLDHPNIVRLISFGQDEGMMFFAMELVDGESLYAIQKKRKNVDWREMLPMATDICAGLKHAHDRGIIHRDLKPGNLLRDKEGRVKITDFGIAKSFGASELTGEGNILGTMDFMAPEQAVGKSITARSDLYSLGTVMYALLAGKPPFHAKTISDLATKFTTHKTERISKIVPDVPIELDRLIDNLLQKNPKNRIPTAHALTLRLQEIQEYLAHESSAATEVVPGPSTNPKRPLNDGKTKPNFQHPSTGGLGLSQAQQLTQMEQADETSQGIEADNEELKLQTEEEPGTENTGGPATLANTQTDYFKKVTPNVAAEPVVKDKTQSQWGTWALVLVLVVVVVAGAIGVAIALRKPTADELLAKIDGAGAKLLAVQDEVEQMLEYYPQHERSEEIRGFEKIVAAIKYFNTTNKRAQGPRSDELTQIESQFVDAVRKSRSNLAIGYAELVSASSELRNDPDSITIPMATCLGHSDSYLQKMQMEAESQTKDYSDTVEAAIKEAKSAIPTDQQKARSILKAVVELYSQSDWAEQQVNEAKGLLRRF